MMNPVLNALLNRRSVVANDLKEPGPSADEIQLILRAAHRVPDHGKLGPWRFIIFEGDTRLAFGKVLRETYAEENPGASEKLLDFEQNRFLRAPLVIAVVSSPITDHPKIPVWEQELSTGAACMNIGHAAHSLGYAAHWLTEWYAFNDKINTTLSLTSQERIAGFIYIGSFAAPPSERERPSLKDRISYWQPVSD